MLKKLCAWLDRKRFHPRDFYYPWDVFSQWHVELYEGGELRVKIQLTGLAECGKTGLWDDKWQIKLVKAKS